MDAILFFRAERTCLFNDTFYIATDEERGDVYSFPSSEIFNLPQHFTCILGFRQGVPPTRKDWVVNDEVESRRKPFIKELLAYGGIINDEADGKVYREWVDGLKARYSSGGGMAVDDDSLTVRELRAKLGEMGVAVAGSVTSKGDLLALYKANEGAA